MVVSVGRLAAGGGGGGAAAAGAGASGQASAGAGPLDVLLGVADFPYKDPAEAAAGLLKVENAGRLEAGGGAGFGALGLCAFLSSLISTLPTGV